MFLAFFLFVQFCHFRARLCGCRSCIVHFFPCPTGFPACDSGQFWQYSQLQLGEGVDKGQLSDEFEIGDLIVGSNLQNCDGGDEGDDGNLSQRRTNEPPSKSTDVRLQLCRSP